VCLLSAAASSILTLYVYNLPGTSAWVFVNVITPTPVAGLAIVGEEDNAELSI